MIKAVIFDMGGVILRLDRLKEKLVELFEPSDEDEFWQRFSHVEGDLCRGEIGEDVFWERASEEFGKDVSYEDVKDFWDDNFRDMIEVNKEVLDLVGKLKGKYKLCLLSNIHDMHAKVIRKMNILGDFDEVIFSYEVKMDKTDEDIFELAVEKLGVGFDECVFIDDVEEFVDRAEKLGMKGILFDSNEKLMMDFKVLGIVV
tara:strand:- start:2309 stop:2911 length:603 start_codon:yes stop_codon:yes gene_type:complete